MAEEEPPAESLAQVAEAEAGRALLQMLPFGLVVSRRSSREVL
jgi:hypothetical protein